MDSAATPNTKPALRAARLAARRRRPPAERHQAAGLMCERVLALPEMAGAITVAAYVALPGEPDTAPLLSALEARGITVLIPLVEPDRSLRWLAHRPGRRQLSGRAGRERPAEDADEPLLSTASVVICPGVAGDRKGHRLGRGGGSYDRALAEVGIGVLRCLLLFDDEVIDAVPTEPHDQPVDVLVTPSGTLRVPPG